MWKLSALTTELVTLTPFNLRGEKKILCLSELSNALFTIIIIINYLYDIFNVTLNCIN